MILTNEKQYIPTVITTTEEVNELRDTNGIGFENNYLIRFEIEDERYKGKSVETVLKGVQIIDGFNQSIEFSNSEYGLNEDYEDRKEYLYYHRNLMREIYTIYSHLKIRGDSVKVRNELKELYGRNTVKNVITTMKKGRNEFFKSILCGWVLSKFYEGGLGVDNNTLTLTDVLSTSEEEIITKTQCFNSFILNKFGMDKIKEDLRNKGFIKNNFSYTEGLDEVGTIN